MAPRIACRFTYRGGNGQFSDEQIGVGTADQLQAALREATGIENTVVIYGQSCVGGSGPWWDIPVLEVSGLESTQQARKKYEEQVRERMVGLNRGSP